MSSLLVSSAHSDDEEAKIDEGSPASRGSHSAGNSGRSTGRRKRFTFDVVDSASNRKLATLNRRSSTPTHTITHFPFKKLGQPIGQGRYGTVHKVIREDTGKFLAAKICSVEEVRTPSPSSDRSNSKNHQIVSSLKKEVAILSQICAFSAVGESPSHRGVSSAQKRHDHIIEFIGYERTFARFSLFFELMPGGSLRNYLNKNGPLNPETKGKSFIKQLTSAVEFLHDVHNVVHRDIKAANLLLDLHLKHLKICDFGEAKRLHQDLSARSGRSLSGSPLWMAPEVIRQEIKADDNVDALPENAEAWKRADIWSLGCTLVEMLTGKAPWGNMTSVPAAFLHIASTNEAPPLPNDCPATAKAFLNACCATNASERFAARELKDHSYIKDTTGHQRAFVARPTSPLSMHASTVADDGGPVGIAEPGTLKLHDAASLKLSKASLTEPDDAFSVETDGVVTAGNSLDLDADAEDDEYYYLETDDDDSADEWGDMPTPRPLIPSLNNAHASSPPQFVPTLDIRRALSENAKDEIKDPRALKASKRTLAQSAFLKKASKLGGGAWRGSSRSRSSPDSTTSAALSEGSVASTSAGNSRGYSTRGGAKSVSPPKEDEADYKLLKSEKFARLNIRIVTQEEAPVGKDRSRRRSDSNVSSCRLDDGLELQSDGLDGGLSEASNDKASPDEKAKTLSPMSSKRRRHTWGTHDEAIEQNSIRQIRQEARRDSGNNMRVMNFSSASERDEAYNSASGGYGSDTYYSSDGGSSLSSARSSHSSFGTPRGSIVHIKPGESTLGVPVLSLDKTPRWYNQARPTSPGRMTTSGSDDDSLFGAFSARSVTSQDGNETGEESKRHSINELSPLAGRGNARTFFDEALSLRANTRSLSPLQNSTKQLTGMLATSPPHPEEVEGSGSNRAFPVATEAVLYRRPSKFKKKKKKSKKSKHSKQKRQTAGKAVAVREDIVPKKYQDMLTLWLAAARYRRWETDHGKSWEEWLAKTKTVEYETWEKEHGESYRAWQHWEDEHGEAWRKWCEEFPDDGEDENAIGEVQDIEMVDYYAEGYEGSDVTNDPSVAYGADYAEEIDDESFPGYYYDEEGNYVYDDWEEETIGNFWVYPMEAYDGSSEQELSFGLDDWIWVLRSNETEDENEEWNGWWEGINNTTGDHGWFPATFVSWEGVYYDVEDEFHALPEGVEEYELETDADEEWWTQSRYLFQCIASGETDWIRWFLDGKGESGTRHININSVDEYGNTPLIYAGVCGSKKIVKMLLRRDADVDRQNYEGFTVLHACFSNGHSKLGKYLIKKGADPLITDFQGRTCHDVFVDEVEGDCAVVDGR